MSATSAAPASGPAVPANIPTKHPKGMSALFMTEMWERFSYYGMRALLTLYLVKYWGWLPSEASTVYKWYTSLVYLTPLFGGLLADRYLGLRASITAGAVTMAIGEFLLCIGSMKAFYAGLAFLIVGNGLFKPNISTLVGRMYFKNDSRRDGAFTIFYMGINLGAFLSPLVCGWLRKNNWGGQPEMGFRWGFAAAGVGMVLGLLWFLKTQGQVLRDVEAAGNSLALATRQTATTAAAAAAGDEEAPAVTGIAGLMTRLFPILFGLLGVVLPAYYLYLKNAGELKHYSDLIMPTAYGAVFVWMSITLMRIRGAARDKSTCIFIFFIFAVLFWMAFEQAGNALNIWAEYNTSRLRIGSWQDTAEYWQSVNAVAIVLLAPVFSKLWQKLGRYEPSTAKKMLLAMGFMALAFYMMVIGAKLENGTTTRQACANLPAQFVASADGTLHEAAARAEATTPESKPIDAGRLRFDAQKKELVKEGVLGDYLVNNLLEKTVPTAFADEVLGKRDETKNRHGGLEEGAKDASTEKPVAIVLSAAPADFKLAWDATRMDELGLAWDASKRTMTFTKAPDAPTLNEILVSGGDATLRDALRELESKSNAARVSGLWLLLQYLFATLGELCLSPVGLSMVTKLAPLRFASLFMGVWLLSSSVAQYAGGSLGESWGIISPASYFNLFVFTSLIGFGVLLLLIQPLQKMMHDVH